MLLIDLMAQRQSGSSLDDVQKSCLKSKCVKIENKNVIVFENVWAEILLIPVIIIVNNYNYNLK